MITDLCRSWRGHPRRFARFAAIAIAVAATSAAAVDTYSLSGGVIANGAAERSRSACYALVGTIGEPTDGAVASGGNAQLFSGFWYTVGGDDSLFATGFESCGP